MVFGRAVRNAGAGRMPGIARLAPDAVGRWDVACGSGTGTDRGDPVDGEAGRCGKAGARRLARRGRAMVFGRAVRNAGGGRMPGTANSVPDAVGRCGVACGS